MDGRHVNHVEEYGRFLERAVLVGWPLLGFAVFWLSRCKVGRHWWRPLTIAVALPLGELFRLGFRSAGLDEPVAEAARSAVVFLLMAASIWGDLVSGTGADVGQEDAALSQEAS